MKWTDRIDVSIDAIEDLKEKLEAALQDPHTRIDIIQSVQYDIESLRGELPNFKKYRILVGSKFYAENLLQILEKIHTDMVAIQHEIKGKHLADIPDILDNISDNFSERGAEVEDEEKKIDSALGEVDTEGILHLYEGTLYPTAKEKARVWKETLDHAIKEIKRKNIELARLVQEAAEKDLTEFMMENSTFKANADSLLEASSFGDMEKLVDIAVDMHEDVEASMALVSKAVEGLTTIKSNSKLLNFLDKLRKNKDNLFAGAVPDLHALFTILERVKSSLGNYTRSVKMTEFIDKANEYLKKN